MDQFFQFSEHITGLRFGALEPDLDFMRKMEANFEVLLPENASDIVGDRLHISTTRASDRSNFIVNQFSSREVLIKVKAVDAIYLCLYSL